MKDTHPNYRSALLVGLLATGLSFIGSWNASMWTDEAATISASRRELDELLALLHNIDAVHGAYYAFMHFWGQLFGFSPMSLRLPSALAVGVTAAGVYYVGTRLGNHALGIASGVIFALMPRVTWMGMEGRSFAFSALFVVLLMLVLVNAVINDRGRWWVAYSGLAAMGIAVNLYVVLVLGAHGFTLLFLRDRRWQRVRAWFVATLGAVSLASPVVLTATQQSSQLGDPDLSFGHLARSILVNQWFLGETPTNSSAYTSSGLVWKIAAVLLAMLGWLLVARAASTVFDRRASEVRREHHRLYLVWTVPQVVLPTVVVVGYSLLQTPVYNPRYFSFSTPALALCLGLGFHLLWTRREKWIVAGLMCGLVLPIYLSQRDVNAKTASDWVQVAAYMETNAEAGEGVYFTPRYPGAGDEVGQTLRRIRVAYPDGFTGLHDVTLERDGESEGTLDGASRTLQASTSRLKDLRTVWVIRRHDYPPSITVAENQLLRRLGYAEASQWEGPLNNVTKFEKPT